MPKSATITELKLQSKLTATAGRYERATKEAPCVTAYSRKPRVIRRNYDRLDIDRIENFLFVKKTTGKRNMKANVYRNPANVRAGIS
jgi:hypothetical protein